MKIKALILLLSIFWSCNSSDKVETSIIKDEIKNEFSFNSRRPSIMDTSAHANSYEEHDTTEIGETYRAKLFLANARKVYDADSVNPVIKYNFGKFISWRDIQENGLTADIVNDTGHVKFLIQDTSLAKGQTKKSIWYATIKIPLPEKDTLFFISSEYMYKNSKK